MEGERINYSDSPKEAPLKRSYLEDKTRWKVYSISGNTNTEKRGEKSL